MIDYEELNFGDCINEEETNLKSHFVVSRSW